MAALVPQQIAFQRDVWRLQQYAESLGLGLTYGETYRPFSMVLLYYFGYIVVRGGLLGIKLQKARKLSKTLKSKHADKLAVDFALFLPDGNGGWNLTWKYEDYKILGDYWVSLNPELNVWGGDFNKDGIKNGFIDAPHFERVRV